MSSLTRLLYPLPAARSCRSYSSVRTYSSFFSSKPGGGRYFNSAKPPKVVPPVSKKDRQPTSTASSSGGTVDDISSSSSSSSSSTPCDNTPDEAPEQSSPNFARVSIPPPSVSPPYVHPILGDKDFKLHQFFSLHRPLLLLNNPQSILDSAPATHIFSVSPPSSNTNKVVDDRAMTMNRLGAAVDWEATLQRLGLASNVANQAELDKEYRDVMMESTKRKRRKKMKKHKLKKRRRLTRQQRHNQR
uniref:Ribosomal protein mS38 C-terminal domain-containing protein n=1 Tax=Moniliophthora roreri TaxID=221103 RepID=A0A0W0FLA1_MONRR